MASLWSKFFCQVGSLVHWFRKSIALVKHRDTVLGGTESRWFLEPTHFVRSCAAGWSLRDCEEHKVVWIWINMMTQLLKWMVSYCGWLALWLVQCLILKQTSILQVKRPENKSVQYHIPSWHVYLDPYLQKCLRTGMRAKLQVTPMLFRTPPPRRWDHSAAWLDHWSLPGGRSGNTCRKQLRECASSEATGERWQILSLRWLWFFREADPLTWFFRMDFRGLAHNHVISGYLISFYIRTYSYHTAWWDMIEFVISTLATSFLSDIQWSHLMSWYLNSSKCSIHAHFRSTRAWTEQFTLLDSICLFWHRSISPYFM